jgi:choline dehydrogenase-like flavoprotein
MRRSWVGAPVLCLCTTLGVDGLTARLLVVRCGRLASTSLDWECNTEPEPHCCARSIILPGGRWLGGSSSMYMRGRPQDYNGWRDAGGRGWNDLLPLFKWAENNRAVQPSKRRGRPLRRPLAAIQ